jgi:hypothetical protein
MATTQIKDGFDGGSDNQLKVNADGSINVNTTGGGSTSNVNIHDSAGNALTSTGGALNVNTSGTSTVTGTVTSNEAGLTAFKTSQYTIGTTPVQLAPTALTNRSSLSITIIASANIPVYIGNSSSVTVSTGYPLYNGSTIQLDLTPSGQVWAVSTTASQTAAILEIA